MYQFVYTFEDGKQEEMLVSDVEQTLEFIKNAFADGDEQILLCEGNQDAGKLVILRNLKSLTWHKVENELENK